VPAKSAIVATNVVDPVRPLKTFDHGGGGVSSLSMARFYWPAGEGLRETIEPRFIKKRRPAGAESEVDTAAKVEVLLPADAPQDYADPCFIVRHYQASLPPDEVLAFVQVTIRFGDSPNLHHPYEKARSWIRSHFVESMGLPVVLILHAPYLVGSDADGHVHALILPRRASRLGWMAVERDLGNDASALSARLAWDKLAHPWSQT
jgi:hypothetical protein